MASNLYATTTHPLQPAHNGPYYNYYPYKLEHPPQPPRPVHHNQTSQAAATTQTSSPADEETAAEKTLAQIKAINNRLERKLDAQATELSMIKTKLTRIEYQGTNWSGLGGDDGARVKRVKIEADYFEEEPCN